MPFGNPMNDLDFNSSTPASTSAKKRSAWAALAVGVPVVILLVLSVWQNTAPIHLLAGWLTAVGIGHVALGRLKDGAPRGISHLRIARGGTALAYLLPVLFLGFTIAFAPEVRWGLTKASNIRHIGQASLIFANDHREQLPAPTFSTPYGYDRETTLHDVAFLLARMGGLNEGRVWISGKDHTPSDWEFLRAAFTGKSLWTSFRDQRRPDLTSLRTVLNHDRSDLNPHFAKLDNFFVDYVTGLEFGHPSTTPIAWTRGLREDGSWDQVGVHGTDGGHIVFLGGNVSFFRNLQGENQLTRPDGTRTSNILETLPPGARVVGAGPASLNGRLSPNQNSPDPH